MFNFRLLRMLIIIEVLNNIIKDNITLIIIIGSTKNSNDPEELVKPDFNKMINILAILAIGFKVTTS